jgi:hypothetical protein
MGIVLSARAPEAQRSCRCPGSDASTAANAGIRCSAIATDLTDNDCFSPQATSARVTASATSESVRIEGKTRDCIRGGRPSEVPPSALTQCHVSITPTMPTGRFHLRLAMPILAGYRAVTIRASTAAEPVFVVRRRNGGGAQR